MNQFEHLIEYLVPNEKEGNSEIYKNYKHTLYPLNDEEVERVNNVIKVPFELKEFYKKIGYGFFFQSHNSFDRLLDPFSFKQINLREDFYEFDPDLELDKCIFFEVNEGVYLLIDKRDFHGKNAIYYFEKRIADSLDEFLDRFDKEGHFFE